MRVKHENVSADDVILFIMLSYFLCVLTKFQKDFLSGINAYNFGGIVNSYLYTSLIITTQNMNFSAENCGFGHIY